MVQKALADAPDGLDCQSKLLCLYLLDFVHTDVEVFAETSSSDKCQKPHPSVWITKHPKAKIGGLALGHDARMHDLSPCRELLTNAMQWAAGK